jgi:hypothetical protein
MAVMIIAPIAVIINPPKVFLKIERKDNQFFNASRVLIVE